MSRARLQEPTAVRQPLLCPDCHFSCERKASQRELATFAPCRAVWSHENFSALEALRWRRNADTPETNNAAADARTLTYFTRAPRVRTPTVMACHSSTMC